MPNISLLFSSQKNDLGEIRFEEVIESAQYTHTHRHQDTHILVQGKCGPSPLATTKKTVQ